MDTTTKGAGGRTSFLHLEPDRDQIEQFVHAIFKYASQQGFVAVRSFLELEDKVFRINTTALTGGLEFLIEVCEDDARRAAQNPKPVVFCPSLGVFGTKVSAAEDNILEGLVITVECDAHPQEARETLEQLLGPATIVVRSGGIITNGSGETIYKLHLHWRLAVPARGDDRARLKRARTIACRLVGADPTSNAISHPIRWAGSWHRKGEPRLCVIDTHTDNEVDLDTALEALTAAAEAAGIDTEDVPHSPSDEPQAPSSLVAAAVEKIPNDDREWADWNNLLMAMWRATDGSEEGRKIAHVFSAKSKKAYDANHKYDPTATNERWDHFAKSPPTEIGFGTLCFLANEVDPNWREEYDRKTAEQSVDWRIAMPRLNISNWDNEPTPEQEWAVPDRIPVAKTTILSGEGAMGKSLIELHQCVAHVLRREWLGTMPVEGPAVFIDAEDDGKVIHKRLADIIRHYGVKFADVAKDLHLVSLAGQDAVLGSFNRKTNRIEPTPRYKQLLEMAGDLKPKLISIASSADVFAGNELDRSQVQQFVGLLTRVAMRSGGGLVLIAHPSLTGISTDTGLSGSTQWHNSSRARFYLKGVKTSPDQPNNDLREIIFKKNNYGRLSENIALRYQNGLFLPIEGSTLDAAVKSETAKDVFLRILQRYIRENRNVSANRGPGYAPTQFLLEQEAKEARCTKADLEGAMRELLRTGGITQESYGKRSNPHSRLTCDFRGDPDDIPF